MSDAVQETPIRKHKKGSRKVALVDGVHVQKQIIWLPANA